MCRTKIMMITSSIFIKINTPSRVLKTNVCKIAQSSKPMIKLTVIASKKIKIYCIIFCSFQNVNKIIELFLGQHTYMSEV